MHFLIFLLIIVGAYVLIQIKIVRIILIVMLGIVYIPINKLYMAVHQWHFDMKKKDIVVHYAFTPFYWIIVGITYIISAPYEFISNLGIH